MSLGVPLEGPQKGGHLGVGLCVGSVLEIAFSDLQDPLAIAQGHYHPSRDTKRIYIRTGYYR